MWRLWNVHKILPEKLKYLKENPLFEQMSNTSPCEKHPMEIQTNPFYKSAAKCKSSSPEESMHAAEKDECMKTAKYKEKYQDLKKYNQLK